MSAAEPRVLHATVRDAGDDLHIECRFDDGQKYAAVTVDAALPDFASAIAAFLNGENVSRETSAITALRRLVNTREVREAFAVGHAFCCDCPLCGAKRVLAGANVSTISVVWSEPEHIDGGARG